MQIVNTADIPEVRWENSATTMQEIIGKTAHIRDDEFSIARFLLRGDSSVPRHLHHESKEVYIILNGEATMIIDNVSYPICAGDIIYIQEGNVHEMRLSKEEQIEFLALTVPAYTDEDFIEIGSMEKGTDK